MNKVFDGVNNGDEESRNPQCDPEPNRDAGRPPPTLVILQYLRGLAALMVVIYHLSPRFKSMGWSGQWPGWLSAGVDLFFVLSGFLMWVTTATQPTARPFDFAWKRIQRIVPLYWLTTAAVLIVALTAPALITSGAVGMKHVLGSFLFFPVADPGSGLMEPIVPQGWTLNYEMAFYALFALALFLPVRWRLVATVTALTTFGALSYLNFDYHGVWGFYTNAIVLEFGFGIILGAAWLSLQRGRAGGALVGAVVMSVGVALFALLTAIASDLSRTWQWGLPFAVILYGGLQFKAPLELAILKEIGDASYSIYLTHGIVLSGVMFGWKRIGASSVPALLVWFSLCATCLSVVVGCTCYRLVERPVVSHFKRRRKLAAERRTASLPAGRVGSSGEPLTAEVRQSH